ncbi:hypothetical protein B0H13DRAFT_1877061 [Mycena leptocephala]|nr:hypothetical protein B0H13DRAFT_1877061 [Mycena leptocephala]
MGSRKIAAAEEALAGFASDIHPASTVQLDITDDKSVTEAHATIANYLNAKGLRCLDVLINNAAVFIPLLKETFEVNVFETVAITEGIQPSINAGGAILNILSSLGSIATLLKRSSFSNAAVQWTMEEHKKGSGICVVAISPGCNATNLNNYTGTMSPAEHCKVILKAALETEESTAVFFGKDWDNCCIFFILCDPGPSDSRNGTACRIQRTLVQRA